MSYQINLTTTGTPSTVTINDLGDKQFVHPVTGSNLLDEYTLMEIARSTDLSASLANEEITLVDEFDRNISNIVDEIVYINKPRAMGEMIFDSNSTQTALTDDVWAKVAGSTQVGTLVDFTHSDNRLTYVGEVTKSFQVVYAISRYSPQGGFGDLTGTQVYTNGTDGFLSSFQVGVVTNPTGNRRNIAASATDLTLKPNDFVEVWMVNFSDNSDISIGYMTFTIYEMNYNEL